MKHTFIRPLLELLVGRSLLDKLKNLYKRECQKGLRSGAADSRTWSFNSAGARGQALARLAGSDIVFFMVRWFIRERPHVCWILGRGRV